MCRHVAKENINFSSNRNQHPRLQLIFTNISDTMSRTQRYWVQNKIKNKQEATEMIESQNNLTDLRSKNHQIVIKTPMQHIERIGKLVC